ncbi:MAG: hypothetical protein ACLS59_00610 [Clostridia bacterium]|jgi:hypothetical protein
MKELLFYTVLSKRNTKKRLKETGYLKNVKNIFLCYTKKSNWRKKDNGNSKI